ncbi:hypothetical protein KXQ82_10490 [Mucilaginibacter sp. HMF5004]|uniref:hypothetical protein n=1 Tax=Mucilaginibacter rivuli TaxID=2857527 RepID=UPI001C5D296C|nr:hypothetical protein [Mucilaginibacter rivuli]MBW4890147.1 hypothetical protein [Mucilaginibacter rivuli]
MKKILKRTIVLILLSTPYYSFAQMELPNHIPPSPTAMQFQRYGDCPTNTYTGVPDIKVPVFTIHDGDITVPIYLSYHAGGFRPDDQAGMVGLGWTLNTGGMVSRNINGVPDELNWLNILSPSTIPRAPYYGATPYDLLKDLTENKQTEHEFDMYSYNFLNYSGKFLDRRAYEHLTVPDFANQHAYKLTEDGLQVYSGDNGGVTAIVDANGTRYAFGSAGTLGATETQDYKYNRVGTIIENSAPSTWHLATISSNQSYVLYEYQPGEDFHSSTTNYQYREDYEFPFEGGEPRYEDYYWVQNPSWGTDNFSNNNINVNYHTYVPKKISYPGGTLEFFLNTTLQLDHIEIRNIKGELLKTISLQYGMFNCAPFANRAKLASVNFKNAGGGQEEHYSFNYNDENGILSTGVDQWGFCNGTPGTALVRMRINGITNISGAPYTYHYIGGDAVLTPNVDATKKWVLNKITYPTGGYTTYDYEGNWSTGSNKPVGGLRVKNVESYTSYGVLALKKEYSYIAGSSEVDQWINNPDFYRSDISELVDGPHIVVSKLILSEHGPVSMSPKGAPIGYSQVTETTGNIKTTYFYDDGPAYVYRYLDYPGFNMAYNKLYADEYKPWNYGSLTAKHIVGFADNNIYQKQFERWETTDYETIEKNPVHDFLIEQTIFGRKISSQGFSEQETFEIYGYDLFSYANRWFSQGVKRPITQYSLTAGADGQSVSRMTNLEYNNPTYPMQVSKQTTTNSKGDSIATNLKYPYDFTTSPYTEMAGANRVAPVIEQTQTNTTLSKEISHMKSNYGFFPIPGTSDQAIRLQSIESSAGGNALEIRATVNQYDGRGQVLQQTAKDGLVTSFLYGYQNTQLIAVIKGADYASVIAQVNKTVLDDLTTSEASIQAQLNSLRNSLPGAQVTTYTYLPGTGVSSSTDPKGQTITYIYDDYQRLKMIKDQDGKILKANDYHIKP